MSLKNKARMLVLLALAASAPHAALAADNPLLGTWQITEAAIAPWTKDKRTTQTAETRKLMNMQITFSAKAVKSNYPTLSCSDATFDIRSDPPDVLFQGSLPEPNQAKVAESLGFPRGDVPGVEVNCSSGDFPFHFRDKDTALFALNNFIYTLKRR